MTDSFSRNLMMSVGLHFAMLAMIFFHAILVPSDPIDLRSAIRVDVVGLPEKMESMELKPKAEASKPEPMTKPKLPPKVVPEKVVQPIAPTMPSPKAKKVDTSKLQKQALNKIKSQEALDKLKKQMSEEAAAEKSEKTAPKPSQLVKGNAVNEGNSLTGLEKIEFDRYLQDIKQKILDQWSIPEWMADAKLKAQVLVLIDDRGNVIRKVFRRSSGNVVFDNTVTSAIDSSSPLPAPPKRLQSQLETRGIVFNFPE